MWLFDFHDIFALFRWPLGRNATEKIEYEIKNYIGVKYAVATSYGRTSLYLGLRAINVLNKEVLLPSFTCSVVRNAVRMAGAKPVFVDIHPQTFDLNIDDLKIKLNPNTKAVILTHYFGRAARNIEGVANFAKENNLYLVEDCAHSLGATYKGEKIGTIGDFAIFSLTKNMINFGGGILTTNSRSIYKRAGDIIASEKDIIRKRILDFPFILAYGLEQFIDKTIYDQVGNLFKWWLRYLPEFFLVRIRRSVIGILKLPVNVFKKENE